MSDLTSVVFDADVVAAVEAARTEEIPLPNPGEEGYDPLVTRASILRPADPLDYVAAINQNLDKFQGLAKKDVTVDAVAAVLEAAEAVDAAA